MGLFIKGEMRWCKIIIHLKFKFVSCFAFKNSPSPIPALVYFSSTPTFAYLVYMFTFLPQLLLVRCPAFVLTGSSNCLLNHIESNDWVLNFFHPTKPFYWVHICPANLLKFKQNIKMDKKGDLSGCSNPTSWCEFFRKCWSAGISPQNNLAKKQKKLKEMRCFQVHRSQTQWEGVPEFGGLLMQRLIPFSSLYDVQPAGPDYITSGTCWGCIDEKVHWCMSVLVHPEL